VNPSALDLLILSGLIALGLWIGKIKIGGFRLGVAGILLAGVVFSRFDLQIDSPTLHFLRDLGLVLFVYAIGNQLGPSFPAVFQKDGWRMNVTALLVVISGSALAFLWVKLAGQPAGLALGTLSGAVTNTPSLAAMQETLRSPSQADQAALLVLGYSLAYPLGILGILGTIHVIRKGSKTDWPTQVKQFEDSMAAAHPKLTSLALRLQNPLLEGQPIHALLRMAHGQFIVSRLERDGELHLASPDLPLRAGDILQLAARPEAAESLTALIGPDTGRDLKTKEGPVIYREIVVTRRAVIGKKADSAHLTSALASRIVITRLIRAGIELVPPPGLRWHYGDVVRVVGQPGDVEAFAGYLGNSRHDLTRPKLFPLGLGLVLGIALGQIPLPLPFLEAPLKLGLAGGPLLAGLILTQLPPIRTFTWQLPQPTNEVLRHAGIILFLSAVALSAGEAWDRIGEPAVWIPIVWMALLTTLLPLTAGAILAIRVFKMPSLQASGVLAGSMTDPPALGFLNQLAPGNMAAPLAFSSVYPVTMLSRVLFAQVLAMLLF